MGVQQNNFRDMLSVYLPVTAQTQHVFCVFPAVRVTHAGLAGEEGLKAFPLQAFQHGDGGDPGIVLTSGCVLIFSEYAGDDLHQFFTS
ncbi:Uncharacterised protein [Escherichia coli]|nr:Uncharacterised protein [Escherichia coli]